MLVCEVSRFFCTAPTGTSAFPPFSNVFQKENLLLVRVTMENERCRLTTTIINRPPSRQSIAFSTNLALDLRVTARRGRENKGLLIRTSKYTLWLASCTEPTDSDWLMNSWMLEQCGVASFGRSYNASASRVVMVWSCRRMRNSNLIKGTMDLG